jgi:hypothetical protein
MLPGGQSGKIVQTQGVRVDTHFILDGSSEKILRNIWISPKTSAVNPEWNYVISTSKQVDRFYILVIIFQREKNYN